MWIYHDLFGSLTNRQHFVHFQFRLAQIKLLLNSYVQVVTFISEAERNRHFSSAGLLGVPTIANTVN